MFTMVSITAFTEIQSPGVDTSGLLVKALISSYFNIFSLHRISFTMRYPMVTGLQNA